MAWTIDDQMKNGKHMKHAFRLFQNEHLWKVTQKG